MFRTLRDLREMILRNKEKTQCLLNKDQETLFRNRVFAGLQA